MVWEAGQTVPLEVNGGDTGKIHTPGSSCWSPELSRSAGTRLVHSLSARPWRKCGGRERKAWVSR